MLLSLELRSEYQEVLTKAQAVQLCGDKDPRCPTEGVHEMLVSMHAANMMHDETKVKTLLSKTNEHLDKVIAESNPGTRAEIIRFISEAKENTWIYSKLSEMNSKLDHMIQGQEIYGTAPATKQKKETLDKPKDKQCRTCGRTLAISEFPCSGGKPTKADCKACAQELEKNERFLEATNTSQYKTSIKFISKLKLGDKFQAVDIVKAYSREFLSSRAVGISLKYIESTGVIKFYMKQNKGGNVYIKV